MELKESEKKTEAQGNKNVANKDSQYLVTYSVDVYKTNKAGRRGRRGGGINSNKFRVSIVTSSGIYQALNGHTDLQRTFKTNDSVEDSSCINLIW